MSEIRVNRVVSADGTSAPTMTYGFQVPTGIGITGAGGINITGVCTAGSLVVGSGIITASSSGVNITGVCTATTFIGAVTGDATGLSGTPNISCGTIAGSTGTFSGAVNVDATTDSTSSTTGSLIVDGGLGVAKNVYIGAGLSVAGTLTYEDVTSVDSVGLITAKSGVNVTGGQLTVGVAYSVGAAGVCTAAGFVGPLTGDVTGTASNADHILVTDNESTNENNLITFVENQTSSTGQTGLEFDGDLYYNPSTGRLTATQLSGTLQTAAQTNVTSVGTLAGLTVGSAGEFKVGTALTMASTSGVATFSNEVWFNNPADGAKYARWRPSQDRFELQDDTTIAFGDAEDLQIYHNGSHSYLKNGTGNLYLTAKSDEDGIIIRPDAGTELYHNNVKRIETTLEGVNVSGMISATAGLGVTGGMWEGAFISNERLSQHQTLGISTSNIFVFTNTENATATPNIIWNDSYALSSKMNVGDAVTITVITTAAAAGYSANWTIDGNAVTEQWNGGSAPSEGGSDGYDIYTHTLVRKATGTGDTGWLMFSNLSNFT